MGLGDWIMATAQVREMNLSTGRQVCVIDRFHRRKWSPVFEHNPRITRDLAHGAARLLNAPGDRPYIRTKEAQRWVWKRWNIAPGELFLSDEEKQIGERYAGRIMIEPNVKDPQGNKAWLWERWQAVADALDGALLVQCGEASARRLRGVEFVPSSFREALGLLNGCALFVGTEGALHHAAAALGKPAVVLWSEFIAPEFTGYPAHLNLRHAGAACGARVRCESCRTSMAAISVDEVVAAVRSLL